ncbi:hypothetical protein SAFG77S_03606 [Streptomyces afghaniensis]
MLAPGEDLVHDQGDGAGQHERRDGGEVHVVRRADHHALVDELGGLGGHGGEQRVTGGDQRVGVARGVDGHERDDHAEHGRAAHGAEGHRPERDEDDVRGVGQELPQHAAQSHAQDDRARGQARQHAAGQCFEESRPLGDRDTQHHHQHGAERSEGDEGLLGAGDQVPYGVRRQGAAYAHRITRGGVLDLQAGGVQRPADEGDDPAQDPEQPERMGQCVARALDQVEEPGATAPLVGLGGLHILGAAVGCAHGGLQ